MGIIFPTRNKKEHPLPTYPAAAFSSRALHVVVLDGLLSARRLPTTAPYLAQQDLCRRCYTVSGARGGYRGGGSALGPCTLVGRDRHPFVQGEAATDPPEWKSAESPDAGRTVVAGRRGGGGGGAASGRAGGSAAAGVLSLQVGAISVFSAAFWSYPTDRVNGVCASCNKEKQFYQTSGCSNLGPRAHLWYGYERVQGDNDTGTRKSRIILVTPRIVPCLSRRTRSCLPGRRRLYRCSRAGRSQQPISSSS